MRFPPEETRRIREAVFRRARYQCENDCGCKAAHMDHFFGRRIPQSEANCWALCVQCDRDRTDNRPAAAYWCRAFVEHCERHGYTAEAERAGARLLVLKAKGMA